MLGPLFYDLLGYILALLNGSWTMAAACSSRAAIQVEITGPVYSCKLNSD